MRRDPLHYTAREVREGWPGDGSAWPWIVRRWLRRLRPGNPPEAPGVVPPESTQPEGPP